MRGDDPDARLEAAEPPEQPVVEAAPFPGRAARGQPHHDPVAPELLDELHLAIGKGLALVRVKEGLAPEALVRGLARYADAILAGDESLPSDRDDAALALACLYGQAIGLAHGWGWGHVRCTRKPGIFVISRDRRHVVGPRAVIDEALRVGGAVIVEHWAKLSDRERLPPAKVGDYRLVAL